MESKTLIFLVTFSVLINHFTLINGKTIASNHRESTDYQGNTLKLLQEQKVANSFVNLSSYGGIKSLPDRFEASDIVLRRDGEIVFGVFDNSYHIGAFCSPLGRSVNCTDRLLAWPDESLAKKKSEFEGMTYNPVDDTYFVAQETIKTADEKIFRSNVFEIRIDLKDSKPIRVLESCIINWDFLSENKGIEGLEFVSHTASGKNYLLALCEANDCNHKSKSDNKGRILVLEKKKTTTTNNCSWEAIGSLYLPSWVHFSDYSSMSIKHQQFIDLPTYISVTSQEMSQIWIGWIEEINRAPFFSISSLQNPIIYDLPLTSTYGIQYCNIEGIAWKDNNQIILASDAAKDDQSIQCFNKQQSIHYFSFTHTIK